MHEGMIGGFILGLGMWSSPFLLAWTWRLFHPAKSHH
jgi:hypothetical protein